MTGYIPIQCEETPGTRANVIWNKFTFVIPSLGREFTVAFTSSTTAAALKRITKIIDMEIAGADKDDLVAAIEKMAKSAKTSHSTALTEDELEEFKAKNCWLSFDDVLDEVESTMDDESLDILGGEIPEMTPGDNSDESEISAEITRAATPVITSDGRYIVNPLVGTANPVDEIPESIRNCMACFIIMRDGITVTPGEGVPAGMEHVATYEYEAAKTIAYEVAEILGMPAGLVEFYDPAAESVGA